MSNAVQFTERKRGHLNPILTLLQLFLAAKLNKGGLGNFQRPLPEKLNPHELNAVFLKIYDNSFQQ